MTRHECAACGTIARTPNLEVDDARGKAEIAKCEIVCANCHRIRTHDRSTTS